MPDFAALYRQAANDHDLELARKVVAAANTASESGLMTDEEISDLFTAVRSNPMLGEGA